MNFYLLLEFYQTIIANIVKYCYPYAENLFIDIYYHSLLLKIMCDTITLHKSFLPASKSLNYKAVSFKVRLRLFNRYFLFCNRV